MRRAGLLALVLALGLLGLWPLAGPAAAGDASRCHAITDRDRRHACLAETRGRQQDCNAIRDIDNRAMCSARTSGQRSLIVSPFFAKPEMDPSDFRSKKLATGFAFGCPRSSCVRPVSVLRFATHSNRGYHK